MSRNESSIRLALEQRLERYHDPYTNQTFYHLKISDFGADSKHEEYGTAPQAEALDQVQKRSTESNSIWNDFYSSWGFGSPFPADPMEFAELAAAYTNECRLRALSELHELQYWLEKTQPTSAVDQSTPFSYSSSETHTTPLVSTPTKRLFSSPEDPDIPIQHSSDNQGPDTQGWSHFMRQLFLFGALPLAISVLFQRYPGFNCPTRIRDEAEYIRYLHFNDDFYRHDPRISAVGNGDEKWWPNMMTVFPASHFISFSIASALLFLETVFAFVFSLVFRANATAVGFK